MNANRRLDNARRLLALGAALAALAWATVLGGGVYLLIRSLMPSIAVGVVTAAALAWRNRAVYSRREVALWLENRLPEMRYAMVTLAEGQPPHVASGLEQVVAGVSWRAPLRTALLHGVAAPLLLAAVILTAVMLIPAGLTRNRTSADHSNRPGSGAVNQSDPFRSISVVVEPPAYTHLPRVVLDNPENVRGVVGSIIRIDGRGDSRDLVARPGGPARPVAADGDRWAVSFPMPDSAAPVWLESPRARRLLVLEPFADSAPVVLISDPRSDAVRPAAGSVALRADARDDFGLRDTWFEYIVSSGEGENFTFRPGVIDRRDAQDRRSITLAGVVSLDSLRLAPGNIVHLRAVARDRNDVTGPGVGYSETRTIRIPRQGEGAEVLVDAAAPAYGDSSLLSQRMLLMMAEALQRRRPRLARDTVIAESRAIARDQAALRRRVADIIFLRLSGDESAEEAQDTAGNLALTPEALLQAAEQATVANGGEPLDFTEDESPVVHLNRPLLEAYNAMWAAGRELDIGEPGRALPHMRAALEAIQRAREAERLYLRGRPAARVVDLARVRLTGKLADARPASSAAISARAAVIETLTRRYSRALALLPDPAAVDSLVLLRLDAIGLEPGFATALAEALSRLRSGEDATANLIRARRLLAGEIRSEPSLPAWSSIP